MLALLFFLLVSSYRYHVFPPRIKLFSSLYSLNISDFLSSWLNSVFHRFRVSPKLVSHKRIRSSCIGSGFWFDDKCIHFSFRSIFKATRWVGNTFCLLNIIWNGVKYDKWWCRVAERISQLGDERLSIPRYRSEKEFRKHYFLFSTFFSISIYKL